MKQAKANSSVRAVQTMEPTSRALGVPLEARLTRDEIAPLVRAILSAPNYEGKTVIAGYPWFLDWGRDSLICARGLIAAGMLKEVEQLLLTFAKFEKNGTLARCKDLKNVIDPATLNLQAAVTHSDHS